MRAFIFVRAGVFLGAASAVLLTSCGSTSVTSTPDATVTATAVATTTASGAPTTTAIPATSERASTTAATRAPTTTLAATTTTTVPAAVGSTITLKGSEDKLAVTLAEWREPVEPGRFFKPDEGKHYVGVKLRIVNTGTTVWSDSISNGAKLVDDKRQEYRATISGGSGLGGFTSAPVSAGDTRLGWVVFEVPDGTVFERFTLALDSGFADQTGQWLLGSGAAADPAPTVKVPEAGTGSGITLAGSEDKMKVTVLAVVDPAEPGSRFSTVDAGMRLVAVQFEFANVGSATYDDSPTNGMTLVDSLGQMWRSTYTEVSAGPAFAGSVTIAPNDSRVGWVAFEVPADTAVAKVQVALDSGFADQVGEWRIVA